MLPKMANTKEHKLFFYFFIQALIPPPLLTPKEGLHCIIQHFSNVNQLFVMNNEVKESGRMKKRQYSGGRDYCWMVLTHVLIN